MNALGMFWWIFAIRGGLALLFSLVLYCAASLLGSIFFDPVLLVVLSLLLGSYVLGNALLLGVASVFALEHRRPFGWLHLGEALFAVGLAGYIGHSLLVTPESLALLAGIHALGTGCFQASLALRLRHDRHCLGFLGLSAALSLAVGLAFLTNHAESVRPVAHWLSLYELLYGLFFLTLAILLHRRQFPLPQPA